MGKSILKPIPVGVSDFVSLRECAYEYVDKTGVILDHFRTASYVTFYARPRGFGKSLNLSMFRAFLEIGSDGSWFQGLRVMEDEAFVKAHMGKYPVIHLASFEDARNGMFAALGREATRFSYLPGSKSLTEEQKASYRRMIWQEGSEKDPRFLMSEEVFIGGLRTLAALLHRHHGVRCVVLIDDLDVPLEKGLRYGFSERIRSLVKDFSRTD